MHFTSFVMRNLRGAVVMAALCCTASLTLAAERDGHDRNEEDRGDWRRKALQNMHVAAADHLITDPVELRAYRAAGFNTLVVYDAHGYNESGTAWKFRSEDEIRTATVLARENGLPLVIGLAVEPYVAALSTVSYSRGRPFTPATHGGAVAGAIPQATDAEIRERVALWKTYGDDVVVGVFPWYDDVFYQTVSVDRQRHVYDLIKEVSADVYVFGMIGEFGFNATDDEVARYYDPAAFDHLIVLMYPYNVGSAVTGFPLDHVASSDPDGDITRYVDRFITRMDERFFSRLNAAQLILLVGQAFYYEGEPAGHIPRRKDIEIMMGRGTEQLRKVSGQKRNQSAAYYHWGSPGSMIVGLSQREDWLAAARDVNDVLERPRKHIREP